MKLDDVTKVKICCDDEEINELLDQGFKILKIISGKTVRNGEENIAPVIVLGKK